MQEVGETGNRPPSSHQAFHSEENVQNRLYFLLLYRWISEEGGSNGGGVSLIIFWTLGFSSINIYLS